MKLWVPAVIFVSSTALAQLPSFSFPAPKIDLPAVPLLDRAKEGAPSYHPMNDATQWFRSVTAKRAPKVERYASSMPIVRPPDRIDPKMVHAPRTDIDFKMIVKEPGMAARGAEDGRKGPKPEGDSPVRRETP